MSSKNKLQAFTLIELLVVITILAIISVVAYTNFSWATDKAKNSKKLNDVSSIETWLNMYFQDKNYYPMPALSGSTNLWWYDSTKNAQINNTITLDKPEAQILWILATAWWWNVTDTVWSTVIWAKWTIDKSIISKQYLSQELYDPSLKDIKVGPNDTMKDFWIGKYVYWVYAKGNTVWDSSSHKGSAYNVAVTIKDEQKWYLTKIIGNFDKDSCTTCPNSLIWPWWVTNNNLTDWESSLTWSLSDANERTPYPIQF